MRVKCNFCGAKFAAPHVKFVECYSCGTTNQANFTFEEHQPTAPAKKMVYDIEYTVRGRSRGEYDNSKDIVKREEATKRRYTYIQDKPEWFMKLSVLGELGYTDTTWILDWYAIGLKNPWIASAYDPSFDTHSFVECKKLTTLLDHLSNGGYALGSAFYYKDLVFIQQVSGGDEWLIARQNVEFESYSCGYVIDHNENKFIGDVWKYLNTPVERLKGFDYVELPETVEFDGITYDMKGESEK